MVGWAVTVVLGRRGRRLILMVVLVGPAVWGGMRPRSVTVVLVVLAVTAVSGLRALMVVVRVLRVLVVVMVVLRGLVVMAGWVVRCRVMAVPAARVGLVVPVRTAGRVCRGRPGPPGWMMAPVRLVVTAGMVAPVVVVGPVVMVVGWLPAVMVGWVLTVVVGLVGSAVMPAGPVMVVMVRRGRWVILMVGLAVRVVTPGWVVVVPVGRRVLAARWVVGRRV
jgi:hypothetical protein